MKPKNRPASSGTLADQISEAERQIKDRQQRVHICTNRLVNDLHQQMTSPATLLLAGGIGFIVGELTSRKHKPKNGGQPSQLNTATISQGDFSPLRKAVNFLALAHTLFQALPLVFIMNTFYPDEATKTGASAKNKKSQNQSV